LVMWSGFGARTEKAEIQSAFFLLSTLHPDRSDGGDGEMWRGRGRRRPVWSDPRERLNETEHSLGKAEISRKAGLAKM
jgi:hypothetical protein